VSLFAVLGLVDLWRLMYCHYLLLPMVAFLFDDPIKSIQIVFASLYFWAGLCKLIMPEFYQVFSPLVFSVVFNPFRNMMGIFGINQNITETLILILTVIFVLFETLMGLLLLFSDYLSESLLQVIMLFNIGMHSYILIFIGIKNKIFTFWCWNIMCMGITQIVFFHKRRFFLEEDNGLTPQHSTINLYHLFIYAVYTIFPISLFFGKCPDPCLSHSYFAPGWYGKSYLIIPQIRQDIPLPKMANDVPLPHHFSDADEILSLTILAAGDKKK